MAHVRVFKHYIHTPVLILGVLDFLAIVLAFYLALLLKIFGSLSVLTEFSAQLLTPAALFALVNLVVMTALGVYQARVEEGLTGMMLRTIVSVILALAFLTLLYYVFQDAFWYFGQGMLSLASVFCIFMMGVSRGLYFAMLNDDVFRRKVLVLGAGKRAYSLEHDLDTPFDKKGFDIIGFIPFGEEDIALPDSRLISVTGTIWELVKQKKIDELVVALDDRRKKLPLDDLLECRLAGVVVLEGASFYERESRKMALEMVTPSWLIFSDGFIVSMPSAILKRTFDLVASFVLLLLTWPIMLMTALAIKVEDGWSSPVFYSQERVGLNGQPFFVHKFRSMITNAEKAGEAVWAQKNDSRVTRVGDFIRKVRIDELPQIFNVLKGEMAFVGPRPERPVFVAKLSQTIPYYNERHRVKPGITGWAQLCFAYADNEEDSREKLRYDLYYIKNQSLLLDLIVLIQTVEVVLFKKGSR